MNYNSRGLNSETNLGANSLGSTLRVTPFKLSHCVHTDIFIMSNNYQNTMCNVKVVARDEPTEK